MPPFGNARLWCPYKTCASKADESVGKPGGAASATPDEDAAGAPHGHGWHTSRLLLGLACLVSHFVLFWLCCVCVCVCVFFPLRMRIAQQLKVAKQWQKYKTSSFHFMERTWSKTRDGSGRLFLGLGPGRALETLARAGPGLEKSGRAGLGPKLFNKNG